VLTHASLPIAHDDPVGLDDFAQRTAFGRVGHSFMASQIARQTGRLLNDIPAPQLLHRLV
jgi:hypothetical protein